jgi:hypothetical protein
VSSRLLDFEMIGFMVELGDDVLGLITDDAAKDMNRCGRKDVKLAKSYSVLLSILPLSTPLM